MLITCQDQAIGVITDPVWRHDESQRVALQNKHNRVNSV
jgi:hypothetical protein